MANLSYAEIKKALEHCSDGTGKGIIQSAIDLIDSQQAEIERYRETVGELVVKDGEAVGFLNGKETKYIDKEIAETFKRMAVKTTKSEAVKEFADKLLRSAIVENDGSFANGYIRLSDFYEILSDMEAKYES